MKRLLQTEFRVAFHKESQPLWVRITKYLLLILFVFFFWNAPYFWWIFTGLLVGAILLHGFYRYKTKGWTRSYGRGVFRWDHAKLMTKK